MAMTTANLRAALERPLPPAPIHPPPGYRPPRPFTPYYPPPPLGALTRLDPLGKLALCVAIVAPVLIVILLIS